MNIQTQLNGILAKMNVIMQKNLTILLVEIKCSEYLPYNREKYFITLTDFFIDYMMGQCSSNREHSTTKYRENCDLSPLFISDKKCLELGLILDTYS